MLNDFFCAFLQGSTEGARLCFKAFKNILVTEANRLSGGTLSCHSINGSVGKVYIQYIYF